MGFSGLNIVQSLQRLSLVSDLQGSTNSPRTWDTCALSKLASDLYFSSGSVEE